MLERRPDYKGRGGMLAVTLMVLCIVGACATLSQPHTFKEKLAAGYIAQTAVLKAATNSLAAGDISVSDAERVQKIAADARAVLDAAKVAGDAGELKTAEGRLTMATSILLELQTFLGKGNL